MANKYRFVLNIYDYKWTIQTLDRHNWILKGLEYGIIDKSRNPNITTWKYLWFND